ncbi:AraC family transcriptional regulator [Mesonia aestuariivivens]|uniref:AraC family transcriptional regulator n=1 Tax=Mesonia aestuariivivens TaxID=2796128 RepID=A0ABS6W5E6_9FLAO|nr:AraC family transcriptional regulator [Mesonia aestuariivivens]MBW2962732.1 AraC family transcriptional regulator [Mesonia aestuariivivens]
MAIRNNAHREITQLAPEDSFLVFDRIKSEFDFPIHFHPEYELNFIHNGKGVRRIVGDSLEEIDDLELVLVGPNLVHGWELHNCKNDNIHEITIQFHNDLFDEKLLSRRIFKPIKDMFNRSNHGILFSKKITKELMPRIMKLSKIDSMDYFLELISILQDLANSRKQHLLSTYISENKNFENSDKIKVIYEYVQENFSKKVTLAEISSLVNMSPVSFNRFIKKRTGKTFIDYMNDTRISYATRWLIETDLSIGEIGFKCGFNNIANFNRVFRKVKNCTPSDFREEFEGIKRVL